ncbi:MAG: hypothetical protein LBO08_01270 [Rickettsiales bacterium]|jgi:hypothetical protein|nr:hypothetical protein [Rickettsiales bacterium]
MNKAISLSLVFGAFLALCIGAANAVCPVCTVAVGAGLTFLEAWGVDLVLAGIWAGALTFSFAAGTAKWLNARGLRSPWWYLADAVLWYGFLACVYLLPAFKFGGPGNTVFGIDKLMLGIIVGSFGLYFGDRWYAHIKRKNGGHAQFPFQKIVVPIGVLAALTAIFAGVVYL